MQQQGNNEGTVTAKIKIELRNDQKADVVKAAKEIGATAVLDVLDEMWPYKSWVVFKSYLDRAIVEKGETKS